MSSSVTTTREAARMGARMRARALGALLAGAVVAALGATSTGTAQAATGGDDVALRVNVSTTDGGTPTGVCALVYAYDDPTDLSDVPRAQKCAAAGAPQVSFDRSDLAGIGDNPNIWLLVRADEPYADTWFGQDPVRWYQDWAGPRELSVPETGAATVAVVLPPAGHLTGTLRESETGPLVASGAALAVDRHRPQQQWFAATVVDGRWTMKVFPGFWLLRYRDLRHDQIDGVPTDGPAPASPGIRVAPGATVPTSFAFLPPEARGVFTVTGVVRDKATDRPLAGLCVYPYYFYREDGDVAGGEDWDGAGCPDATDDYPAVRTSPQGRFRVTLPAYEDAFGYGGPALTVIDPTGRHREKSAGWGWGDAFLPLPNPGALVSFNLDLTPTAAVRGRVVDTAGRPVAGMCPGLVTDAFPPYGLKKCSDADGWWLVGDVSPEAQALRKVRVTLAPLDGVAAPWVYVPGVTSLKQAKKVALIPGRSVTAPLTTVTVGDESPAQETFAAVRR
ncbi:MAG: hypothetical protein U0Q15_00275 [Kineosporiaceae bacterium]